MEKQRSTEVPTASLQNDLSSQKNFQHQLWRENNKEILGQQFPMIMPISRYVPPLHMQRYRYQEKQYGMSFPYANSQRIEHPNSSSGIVNTGAHAAPNYVFPEMIYNPMMYSMSGMSQMPPHMSPGIPSYFHPVQDVNDVKKKHHRERVQQDVALNVDESGSEKTKSDSFAPSDSKSEQSWAQIARDPDVENLNSEQNSFSVPNKGENENKKPGILYFDVKEIRQQVQCFQKAQSIFVLALRYNANPFVFMFLMHGVPPEIQNMILQKARVPQEFEMIESIAQHIRSICFVSSLAFVNAEIPNSEPNMFKEYFVVNCNNETAVFQFIRRGLWIVDTPESEEMLVKAMAKMEHILLFFTIPSLSKFVGCAEMVSIVLQNSDCTKTEKIVKLRWIYILDISLLNFASANFLNNPLFQNVNNKASLDIRNENDGKKENTKDEKLNDDPGANTATSQRFQENKSKKELPDISVKNERFEVEKRFKHCLYDGPPFYGITSESGREAFDTIIKFYSWGGMHIDLPEYFAAEEIGREVNPENMLCGGPRMRAQNPMGRGGYSYGRGRNGRARNNDSINGEKRIQGGNFQNNYHYPGNRPVGSHQHQFGKNTDKKMDESFTNNRRSGSTRNSNRGGRVWNRGAKGGIRGGSDNAQDNVNSVNDDQGGTSQANGNFPRGNGRTKSSFPNGSCARRVKGSDGIKTLRSEYTLDIQQKKKKGSSRGNNNAQSKETVGGINSNDVKNE